MNTDLKSNLLTGFQYRAARSTLNLEFREIANSINMHPVNLVRFNKTGNLDIIPCYRKNNLSLKLLFESYNLYFPDKCTISLKIDVDTPLTNYLTRFQFKAARIATRLTQEEFGNCINVSDTTIGTLESLHNLEYIDSRVLNTKTLKRFLIDIGMEFYDDLSVSILKDPYEILKKIRY